MATKHVVRLDALTLAQLGRPEEARRYAREALTIQPGHSTAQQVLAALG